MPQRCLQASAGTFALTEFVGKNVDAAPAALFGDIHRGVRMLDQRFGIFSLVREDRDADAHGDERFLPIEDEWADDGAQDLAGHSFGVGDLPNLRKNDQEFVAAQPGNRILFTNREPDPVRPIAGEAGRRRRDRAHR